MEFHGFLGFMTSLLLCTSQLSLAEKQRDIPDYIKICNTKDPKVDDCITNSIQELRPFLAKGIPELNVPKIEPLYLGEILALQGGGIKIKARNVNAYGCSNFTVNRLSADFDRNFIDFGLDFPELYISAEYRVDGRILLLPIYGNGPLRCNVTNCKGDVTLNGSTVMRNGQRYFNINDLNIKVTVGDGSLYLDNLFGGDKVLGNVVNSAINSNFHVFMGEITPSIDRALSAVITDIAQNVASSFTYDQLFPATAIEDKQKL